MQILECPFCHEKMIKLHTIGGSYRNIVDLSLENATETVKCRNCGKKVKYSVRKIEKGEQNGGN